MPRQTDMAIPFKSPLNFNNKRNWSFDPIFPDKEVQCFQKSFDHLFCSAFCFWIPFDVSGWIFKQKFKLNLNETIWFPRLERVFTNMKATRKQRPSCSEGGGRGRRFGEEDDQYYQLQLVEDSAWRAECKAPEHSPECCSLGLQERCRCCKVLLPPTVL